MIENNITAFVGRKGTGKTFRMARMFCAQRRAVLYQPVRVNSECDQCATHITDDGDLQSVFDVIRTQEQFRVIYKVPDSDIVATQRREVYTSILPLAVECYNVGDMTLFIDEAHLICNQMTIDPELRRVLLLARNNQLSIAWVAQSMEVHRDLRRNTDDFYFTRITEPGDLDKIAERCGDRTAERVAALLPLRKEDGKIVAGQCLFWSANNV